MSEMQARLAKRFHEVYGREPAAMVWAPGRVNLIGEHTDYNDGYVLPIAIDKRIRAAAAPSGDAGVTLRSGNLKGEVIFEIDSNEPSGDWGDYAKGVVAKLHERRYPIEGFNAFFLSDLPMGAGMSSSAAMEVVVCYLLQRLFGFSIPPQETAYLCQQAEHEFAGTRCGIMDQFISVMGRAGNALFLDCRTLRFDPVQLSLGEFVLVACDSRVKRGLADSEYNRRRAQCEEGVGIFSQRFTDVKALRDVTLPQLEECREALGETTFRRCRHVVTENARVLASIDAMRERDVRKLGDLMNHSHDSLRDDYEVSCAELDLLVDTARDIEGVAGARLTGGGFGGSTINLVARSSLAVFQDRISETYSKAFDIVPRFFECVPSDGADCANRH